MTLCDLMGAPPVVSGVLLHFPRRGRLWGVLLVVGAALQQEQLLARCFFRVLELLLVQSSAG
jgi:hypothetical protein